jgi:hypothetical protein
MHFLRTSAASAMAQLRLDSADRRDGAKTG